MATRGRLTAAQVMPLLLAACPSFAGPWAAEVEEYNREETFEPIDSKRNVASDSGRLDYLDAGDFVAHMVGLKKAGATGEFSDVFEVIEKLVTEGDDYVVNLAVIGYIEGFQMMTVTRAGLIPERDFRPYLGPASEEKWAAINEFWERLAQSHQPDADD